MTLKNQQVLIVSPSLQNNGLRKQPPLVLFQNLRVMVAPMPKKTLPLSSPVGFQ